jgi:murein DD-endopeptidase MepM/ murein hydrolase activator NlpD
VFAPEAHRLVGCRSIDTASRHIRGTVRQLEPLLREGLAAVSRILDRLAHIVKSPGHPSGLSGGIDPLDRLRRAASRLSRRDGVERLVPVGACALLVLAAVVSSLPEVSPASAAARPTYATQFGAAGGAVPKAQFGAGDGPLAANFNDLYLGDGSIPNTLQNPGVGVDANTLLQTYTVQAGDTLGLIAGRFGLATSTVYWANKSQLPNPASIRVGQRLLIPPMDGLLVKVGAKDTLASLAAKYSVAAQDIVDVNNLPDATLMLGQTLLIPGASGGPMPTPKAGSGGTAGRTVSVGSWLWPVTGYSYISQYFWSGHHAIDIAAPYGAPVVAAVSGTVIFAGWRSYTGGGNVIWVMENGRLYTTYNHLSKWFVHAGQKISAGQRIGSIGTSGEATGPHLHFEVWTGYPWALGTVADAVNPCNYLAGC